MSDPITTVVFDIGNVLIEWNPEHLYRKLIPDDLERARFLETVCSAAWNEQQDLGRSWSEAVELLTRQHPEKAALIAAYDVRWHEMVPGEIPGTVEILTRLKAQGVPLYAITNFSTGKFAEARRRFPFLETGFEDVVISGEEKLIKPDPRIYAVLFERNGLEAKTCLFIDDSLPNVEAAREAGMRAHHFRGAEGLRSELADLGLLAM
ncbi:HAD family phosphatase [Labrenzia sp. 011]|uniref:HAD family hydrolase n=1 Tax=Labrenzia sp. 011 TaxID=2171494 RepID=UPI000D51923A|nr:HAD family phosphatase [Labrenzia sp. 011]PVB60254.1 2-haloalkanoic acid dehalogenase [Labrenzia sp. 011]